MTDKFILPNIKQARNHHSVKVSYDSFALPQEAQDKFYGKKFLINTYGCQANEVDSEFIIYILNYLGFRETLIESEADLILFNSCAIRHTAENKIYGEIGRLQYLLRQKPDLKIGLMGCMPQQEVVVSKIIKQYPYVNLVIGTHNLDRMLSYIDRIYNGEKVIEVYSDTAKIIEPLPRARKYKHKAFVQVMHGCDEFCTYCIVPYTRGKERSRQPKDILHEIRNLVSEGVVEITLIGQNVDSYGLDFTDKKYEFHNLLTDIITTTSIKRVRFMTSYPRDISIDTIKTIAKYPQIMPAIHLPVQSGSDTVLKKMNRHYTVKQYLQKVKLLKKYVKGISITTDIIVAFPGETNKDFKQTLKLCHKAGFEGAFTFIYSPRSDTPAASFTNNTPEEEKKKRLQQLNQVINKCYAKGNKRFKNKVVEVLVDECSKKDSQMLTGYSKHNKIVNFRGDSSLIGQIVKVKITTARSFTLVGELVFD